MTIVNYSFKRQKENTKDWIIIHLNEINYKKHSNSIKTNDSYLWVPFNVFNKEANISSFELFQQIRSFINEGAGFEKILSLLINKKLPYRLRGTIKTKKL